MRNFLPELTNHLQSGATTIATCWIVKRLDGLVLGFTDHDNPIEIDSIVCEASSGFEPTHAISDLGLSIDNQEVSGAISNDSISVKDLNAGRFDGATVEVWMVNWSSPSERHHLRTALLGEVSQEDDLFRAELRGLTSLLDQSHSRTYARQCDAIVGDARCRVDLSDVSFKGQGIVTTVADRLNFTCSGLENFESDWFEFGQLTWTSGGNVGSSVEITGFSNRDAQKLALWKGMASKVVPGDSFEITAGCDKFYATCKSKFDNGTNFRGCPHMPGTDFVLGYADSGDANTGTALVK